MAEQTLQTLGRYTIRAEIGRGGFATVYRALDTALEREVALKVLKPGWTDDPRAVERFMCEARLVARLKHPNIVTIHDVGQADGRLFIAMELVPGRSLQRVVTEDGPLPWERTLAILEQAAAALDYAHKRGLVHRDVKPANIILDESEPGEKVHAVLTDFGLVRGAEQASLSSGSTGGIVGTPEYIAPEVWDAQPATAASDIYALACVAHFMLTGQALFAAATPMAVLKRHMEGPSLPKQWPASVPDSIAEVLRQALEREPERRPQTAGEMVARLQECAEWELKRKAQETEEEAEKVREAERLRQAREAERQAEEEARRRELATLHKATMVEIPPVATPEREPAPMLNTRPKGDVPIWIWGLIGAVILVLVVGSSIWAYRGGTIPFSRLTTATPVVAVMTPAIVSTATLSAPSSVSAITTGTSIPTATSLPATPTPVHPEALIATGQLQIGRELLAVNKQYSFRFQSDGDLVVYDNVAGRSLWSSNTKGTQADHLVMQDNGNLVLYTKAGALVWQSKTSSRQGDYFLLMQDDGTLAIWQGKLYKEGAVCIWLAHREALIAPNQLQVDHELLAFSKRYSFRFQSDGDLVVYDNVAGRSLWSSNTKGTQADHLVMQDDGDLVLYTKAGVPVWQSKTGSRQGDYFLLMQDDGTLAIWQGKLYKEGAVCIWLADREALIAPNQLQVDHELLAFSKRYSFRFQSDGDLVVYDNVAGRSLWSSNTKGSQADHLVMQDNGNLVLYTKAGALVWQSKTSSRQGDYFLLMQDDSNLVIYQGRRDRGSVVPIRVINTSQ